MPLLVSSKVCSSSTQICPSDACLLSSFSVVKSSESLGHHCKQMFAGIRVYDAASHSRIVRTYGEQYPGTEIKPSRGICSTVVSHGLSRTSSGIPTTNCYRNTGSIFQMRFSSSISLDRNGSFYGACSNLGSLAGKLDNNGASQLVLDGFLRETLRYRQRNSRGLAIRCSITVPADPNERSSLDATSVAEAVVVTVSNVLNETENIERGPLKAAFFDVDGTITRTNVVMAYLCVRMAELPFIKKVLWVPWFVLSCMVYIIVDHFHRPTFNRIFYLSYKGRPTDCKTAIANLVFEKYYKPRIMAGASEQILELKQLGYHIVLVTGALDFQIAPLAQELGTALSVIKLKSVEDLISDFVYAAKLVEENGRFTGRLDGMAHSNREKAERVGEYAKRHGISLRDSLAFGDSIADIPMLEVVGGPHAVNPDARLQSIALKRGWAILNWKVNTQKMATASVWAILKWRIYNDDKTATMSV